MFITNKNQRKTLLHEISRERERREKESTDRGGGVVGEPDGGELTPTELPLSDVATTVKLIADSDGVVASLPVGIDSLVVLLRSRR